MPGIHWHADRLEDWVSELGLTTLSDEIADVMLADVMRHWRAAAGSPQVTLIDNIIRDLAVRFPDCPPDFIAAMCCMRRNRERFYRDEGGLWGLKWAQEHHQEHPYHHSRCWCCCGIQITIASKHL